MPLFLSQRNEEISAAPSVCPPSVRDGRKTDSGRLDARCPVRVLPPYKGRTRRTLRLSDGGPSSEPYELVAFGDDIPDFQPVFQVPEPPSVVLDDVSAHESGAPCLGRDDLDAVWQAPGRWRRVALVGGDIGERAAR